MLGPMPDIGRPIREIEAPAPVLLAVGDLRRLGLRR
jgi:hypothetical protein